MRCWVTAAGPGRSESGTCGLGVQQSLLMWTSWSKRSAGLRASVKVVGDSLFLEALPQRARLSLCQLAQGVLGLSPL